MDIRNIKPDEWYNLGWTFGQLEDNSYVAELLLLKKGMKYNEELYNKLYAFRTIFIDFRWRLDSMICEAYPIPAEMLPDHDIKLTHVFTQLNRKSADELNSLVPEIPNWKFYKTHKLRRKMHIESSVSDSLTNENKQFVIKVLNELKNYVEYIGKFKSLNPHLHFRFKKEIAQLTKSLDKLSVMANEITTNGV